MHEPWREKLWYVQARLRAAVSAARAYVDADEYVADLALIDRTLRGAGLAAIAEHDLRDAIRRAEVFGFHLASLDLRQRSSVHDRVVAELLARGGRPATWIATRSAGAPRSPGAGRADHRSTTPAGCLPTRSRRSRRSRSPGEARRELRPRACERYVVSFTREVSDLLEVVFLARAAGLAPASCGPCRSEQLEDLERAGPIAADILAHPVLRLELGDAGLEVMVGYSDSSKQVGTWRPPSRSGAPSSRSSRRPRAGVTLTVFHGRGGALGRGGGPAATRSSPSRRPRSAAAASDRAGRDGDGAVRAAEIAEQDLELLLAAIVGAATGERRSATSGAAAAVDERLLISAAADAGARSRGRGRPGRIPRAHRRRGSARALHHRGDADRGRRALPLGSRPASLVRHLARLAAHPVGLLVDAEPPRHPGWFGVGTAVYAIADEIGAEGARALAERSRFVRALLRTASYR